MKYLVKKWTNNYRREEGLSDIEQINLSLEEALKLCKKIVDNGYALSAEVLTMEHGNDQQCIATYDKTDIKNRLFLELCNGCIKDLDEYNPYIREDKAPVDKCEIVTIRVNLEDCNNNEKNLGIKSGIWMEI